MRLVVPFGLIRGMISRLGGLLGRMRVEAEVGLPERKAVLAGSGGMKAVVNLGFIIVGFSTEAVRPLEAKGCP